MSDLSSLIERLEKAEGPDTELDVDIAIALNIIPSREWWSFNYIKSGILGHYTGTIDAAATLASRMLPSWHADIDLLSHPPMSEKFGARLFDANGSWRNIAAEAVTPALALVLATLRALQSKGGDA